VRLLVDFDARVAGGGVSEDGSGGSKAVSIFVKYDTAFVFDELERGYLASDPDEFEGDTIPCIL
jgi:hypothetical protein